MAAALEHAPDGACVAWGIPFHVHQVVLLRDQPFSVALEPTTARWLVFMHTWDGDRAPPITDRNRGAGALGAHLADYVFVYVDGSEERVAIRGRHQVGAFERRWGENCFQAVAHRKPRPLPAAHEQPAWHWGYSQTRVLAGDDGPWLNWLWAWENPFPDRIISGIRFEPRFGTFIVAALASGNVTSHPLRWGTRQKALLTLPHAEHFLPVLDEAGELEQIRLDLGHVISAVPRRVYPRDGWEHGTAYQLPLQSANELLVEYTCHPEAIFHLVGGIQVPARQVLEAAAGGPLRAVPPAAQRVTIRVVEKGSERIVPVKLHVHGEAGEYLAPVNRHRIPNPSWFEDSGADWVHGGQHYCTYIRGEANIDLPLGRVFVEVSKGFEVRPIRQLFSVTPNTTELSIELEKVLPWREAGWVTADTHVHFLSPSTALLEGEAEGVNIVNLLASQWGELMTNVGDFDGRTTWGAREAGGSGEYLVRVGTENRQHVLGHISLLGYEGQIIAPMTTGGPDESALGDPIEILLTEWARRCKQQGGLVIVPHFPNPRAEHAASIVSGEVDGIEMTSWGNLHRGIDPYSLADWYRYLNCGYTVPAVGGTDKMSADTAVGTVRTYARIPPEAAFTYGSWMQAVRRGETFVTYGPLLEFAVAGQPMGSRVWLPAGGGTLDVTWKAASVTIPITRVDLMVNGEVRESAPVSNEAASGQWSLRVDRSAWLALLVRGQYPDRPEMVAAHSSPVMIQVDRAPLMDTADALSILDQIEGAMAYLDTVGTRAEELAYRRMRLVLEAAHRSLHNRMHRHGLYHDHLARPHAAHD
jgi:hypothetical protein